MAEPIAISASFGISPAAPFLAARVLAPMFDRPGEGREAGFIFIGHIR